MEDMGESGMEGEESVLSETADGTADSEGGSESEALPDFSEEEPLDAALESFEEAMETAAAEAAEGGQAAGMPGAEADESGSPPGGDPGAAGESGPPPGAPGGGETAGSAGNSGPMGEPAGGSADVAGGGGSGVLTGSEQVAILDGQLNRGTGDFDDLILRERGTIQGTAKSAPEGGGDEDSSEGGGGGGGGYNVPPMASSGGGQGGAGPIPRGAYDADIPQQTTAYPPPADIPSGTDDDVVARQLREAAMREPDPKLREKLWDEYRKYKGVD
jgi:hypothetical protein